MSARSVDQLKSLQEEIGSAVEVLPLDVSDQPAIADAGDRIGDLDGVVFLAAAYNPDKLKELISPERIDQVVTVNLTGAMHVTQAVRRKLAKREGTFLALYASIAGYRGLPRGQPYSATKAGLINYAESLRTELRGKVDVKVINSGFVDTRITRQNDFRMPVLMKPEQAAVRIANGLERGGFEICFPKRFAYMVKLLRLLPNWIFFAISRRMV